MLVTATRYLPHEIRKLSFDDINTLLVYWRTYPPAHVLLAAVHRKPARSKQLELSSGSTEAELLAAGIMKINRKPTNER